MSQFKERPILMNGDMVRATLRAINQKTQTRRVQGLEYFSANDPDQWRCVRITDGVAFFVYKNSPVEREAVCKYGKPGDRLWVRESFYQVDSVGETEVLGKMVPCDLQTIRHAATGDRPANARVRPSIHMPRWVSRINLEIINLRIERLQDISEADAKAEGCQPLTWDGTDGMADLIDWPFKSVDRPYANSFALLWESINGPGSWDANPWVWVVEFKRIEKEITA